MVYHDPGQVRAALALRGDPVTDQDVNAALVTLAQEDLTALCDVLTEVAARHDPVGASWHQFTEAGRHVQRARLALDPEDPDPGLAAAWLRRVIAVLPVGAPEVEQAGNILRTLAPLPVIPDLTDAEVDGFLDAVGLSEPVKPRLLHVGAREAIELTPEFYERRTGEPFTALDEHRDQAAEIAPGVRVLVLATGDQITPDGRVLWGARLAVWAEPVVCRCCADNECECVAGKD